jgi:hypothetical protein
MNRRVKAVSGLMISPRPAKHVEISNKYVKKIAIVLAFRAT